jgi:Fe2+ or Zn2+ uptake regulation protein
MSLSLREAGLQVGRSRQALLKAIKKGTLSAEKQTGEWRIEPAELFRVYPPVAVSSSNHPAPDTAGLQIEITLLRERIDDLVEDRDRWRAQAEHVTRLLTDQRPAPQPGMRRIWWRRLFGR